MYKFIVIMIYFFYFLNINFFFLYKKINRDFTDVGFLDSCATFGCIKFPESSNMYVF